MESRSSLSMYAKSALLSVLIVFGIVTLFEPLFFTNDDVGMMFILEGAMNYSSPSTGLIFVNRVLGELMALLPSIGGVPKYSLFMMLCLVFVFASLIYALWSAGFNQFFSVFIIIVLLTRYVLFPQFTIMSGLLTGAGLLLLYVKGKEIKNWEAVIVLLLITVGFGYRFLEGVLLVGICLPFFIKKEFFNIKNLLLVVVTGCSIVAMHLYDKSSYDNQNFSEFNEFHLDRAYLHGYGGYANILVNPDRYRDLNYSDNDLVLMRHGFYLDQSQIQPKMIKRLVDLANTNITKRLNLRHVFRSFNGLFDMSHCGIYAIVLCLLFLYSPKLSCFTAFGLLLSVFLYFAYEGRPVPPRVLLGAITILTIFYLILLLKSAELKEQWVIFVCLFLVSYFSVIKPSYYNYKKMITHVQSSTSVLNSLNNYLNASDKVIFGPGSLAWEFSFPVMKKVPELNVVASGWGWLHPASSAVSVNHEDGSFLRSFSRKKWLFYGSGDYVKRYIGTYCKERNTKFSMSCRKEKPSKVDLVDFSCSKSDDLTPEIDMKNCTYLLY